MGTENDPLDGTRVEGNPVIEPIIRRLRHFPQVAKYPMTGGLVFIMN